jgi:hypothetical protein
MLQVVVLPSVPVTPITTRPLVGYLWYNTASIARMRCNLFLANLIIRFIERRVEKMDVEQAFAQISHLPPASMVRRGLRLVRDHPELRQSERFRNILLQAAFDTDGVRRYIAISKVSKEFGVCRVESHDHQTLHVSHGR